MRPEQPLSDIADNYMEGKTHLAQIHQSVMNIHKMALSHIVATEAYRGHL